MHSPGGTAHGCLPAAESAFPGDGQVKPVWCRCWSERWGIRLRGSRGETGCCRRRGGGCAGTGNCWRCGGCFRWRVSAGWRLSRRLCRRWRYCRGAGWRARRGMGWRVAWRRRESRRIPFHPKPGMHAVIVKARGIKCCLARMERAGFAQQSQAMVLPINPLLHDARNRNSYPLVHAGHLGDLIGGMALAAISITFTARDVPFYDIGSPIPSCFLWHPILFDAICSQLTR